MAPKPMCREFPAGYRDDTHAFVRRQRVPVVVDQFGARTALIDPGRLLLQLRHEQALIGCGCQSLPMNFNGKDTAAATM